MNMFVTKRLADTTLAILLALAVVFSAVPVVQAQAAPEVELECSIVAKSDSATQVDGGNAAELTFGGWSANFDGAAWIWAPESDYVNETTEVFTKSFEWEDVTVSSATLTIASDNRHSFTLGAMSDGDSSEDNHQSSTYDEYDVTSVIAAGTNSLSISVTNLAMPEGTSETNPAGLKYSLEICTPVTVSLGGDKWSDDNSDGVWDEGEEGLGGVTITITDGGEFSDSTVTDEEGSYEFMGLTPGVAYTVCEMVPEGYSQTYPMIVDESGTVVSCGEGMGVGYNFTPEIEGENYGLDFGNHYQDDGGEEEEMPVCIGENLLTNGSFEEPQVNAENGSAAAGGFYAVLETITGWTSMGGFEVWNNMFGGAADGEQNLELDVVNPTTITQSSIPTVVGAEYKLSFDHAARPGTDSTQNTFAVFVDGEEFDTDSEDGTGLEEIEWYTYEYTFDASTTSTEIAFSDLGGDNGEGNLLDNVSLCMTKEAYVEPDYNLVTGYKWNDENGDGVWDEGEDGIEGWTIVATNGETSTSTVTGEAGFYSFALPDGEWTISEVQQSDWTQTGLRMRTEVPMAADPEVTPTTCTFNFNDEDGDDDDDIVDVSISLKVVSEEVGCDFGNMFTPSVSDDDDDNGNNGGGTRVGDRRGSPRGSVLGASTSVTCEGMYLHDYMRMTSNNDRDEVIKLQVFLNAVHIDAPLTGVFDAGTDAAVREFQKLHAATILTPWGITDPTGYEYKTTRYMINNIVCPGSESFPTLY